MTTLYTPRFVRELNAIVAYIYDKSPQAGDSFVENLEAFILLKIAKQPYAYPAFLKVPNPLPKIFRKAVFKKKWNVVYKIQPNHLLFISIFHSSRDIDKMRF